jgi:hypothetical protein
VALDLVLRAGNGGGRTTLAIERLIPGRTWWRTLIQVDFDDRLEVAPRPAPARSSKKAPAKASAGPKL